MREDGHEDGLGQEAEGLKALKIPDSIIKNAWQKKLHGDLD